MSTTQPPVERNRDQLQELLQRLTDREQELMEEAEELGLPPSLIGHFFLYQVLGINPQKALPLVGKRLEGFYTPGVALGVKNEHLLKTKGESRLNPYIFQYDEDLIIKIYNSDKSQEEIVEEEKKAVLGFRESLERYIGDVYNYYTNEDWNNLGKDQKREFLRQMVIVGSDNGRVLGIGDWGVNARIAKGKIACYFYGAYGGLLPEHLAAIGFDVGTDNEALLKDENYDGLKRSRVRGENYSRFMRLVLRAIDELGVGAFQFEDFQGEEAWELLDWARKNLKNTFVFNDDIEGTGAMTIAALLAAENRGVDLADSLYVFAGAGGAGSGIYQQLLWRIEKELREKGLSDDQIKKKLDEVRKRTVFADSAGVMYKGRNVRAQAGKKGGEFQRFQEDQGLIIKDDQQIARLKSFMERRGLNFGDKLSLESYLEFIQEEQKAGNISLGEGGSVVIIGTTTQPETITEGLMRQAYKIIQSSNTGKPAVVLGFSNPTQKTDFLTADEAKRYIEAVSAQQKAEILQGALKRVIQALEGNVLIATGSPFPAVEYNGRQYIIGQGNNVFIFPAVGLGLSLAGVSMEELGRYTQEQVWQEVWGEASQALFDWFKENQNERLNEGVLMPDASDIPAVTKYIALRVARKLIDLGGKSISEGDLETIFNQRVTNLNQRDYPSLDKAIEEATRITRELMEFLKTIKEQGGTVYS